MFFGFTVCQLDHLGCRLESRAAGRSEIKIPSGYVYA